MQLTLPIEPLLLLATLRRAGYDACLVGGSVRDAFRSALTPETDFDLTTNARPEEILALFPESFYENVFGTVSLTKKHLWQMFGVTTDTPVEAQQIEQASNTIIDITSATKLHVSLAQTRALPAHDSPKVEKNYEITTYRAEGHYTDHRRPDQVSWGNTLQEDLSRRDFTMNAMALQVNDVLLDRIYTDALAQPNTQPSHLDLSAENVTLIDPFHGLDDLTAGTLATVGDPAARFEEDALRMLRAIRLSVQLNVQMSDEVFAAISALAEQIQHVSWERIRDEFLKMLSTEYPAEAIELLEDTGLLHYILPELREGIGIEQGGHHTTDVWTHSIDALANCPSKDVIVRLATLLHDIAKPRTYQLAGNKPTFYNHEVIGARVAKQIAERLRLSRRDVQRIFLLVRHHMFYYQPEHTDAAIRRFMRKVGLENINDILDLREGDRLGSGARKTSWRLEEMKQRMVEQLHQPFSITDLEIDGNMLIEQLEMKPGRAIGLVLNALFEEVMEDPAKNTIDYLLPRARELILSQTATSGTATKVDE